MNRMSNMNRRKFLKSMGMVGAGSALMMAFPGCLPKGAGTTASTSGSGEPNFTGKLSVLNSASLDFILPYADEYNKLYNVLPEMELITTIDLQDKLTSTFVARTSPWDAVFTIPPIIASCASKGWLTDISDRAAKSDVYNGKSGHTMLANALKAGCYQEKSYGMPIHVGSTTMIWNKKLMADNDLDPEAPSEWHNKKNSYDDFLAYAKKMTYSKDGVDHYGFVDHWQGRECLYTYFALLQMHGGDAIDQEEKPLFNSEAGIAALEKMVSWLNVDKIIDPASLTYSWIFDCSPSFLAGTRGILITWPFFVNLANNDSESPCFGNTGIAPNFAVDSSASVDSSEFFSIPAFSKNPDEAFRFMELVNSYEFQREMAKGGSWLSAYSDILTDPEIAAINPAAPVVKQVYEHPVKNYVSPNYYQWADILSNHIHDALNQTSSPKDALNAAAKEMEAM